MPIWFTACRCGKMLSIEYNPGDMKELTCDNCGTKIKFSSSGDSVTVHFIPSA